MSSSTDLGLLTGSSSEHHCCAYVDQTHVETAPPKDLAPHLIALGQTVPTLYHQISCHIKSG